MTHPKFRVPSLLASIGLAALLTVATNSAVAHGGEEHATANPKSTIVSADAKAVVATLQGYATAVAGKDLLKVKAFLVPGEDFTYFEGTFANYGWQSYSDHMAPEMALFEKPHYRFTDIRPYVSGNLAYATFDWAMDVTVVTDQFEGGKHAVSMRGRATAVLAKADGEWKIRHLHTATTPAQRADASSH